MKPVHLFFSILIAISNVCFAQSPEQLIEQIKKSQKELKTIYFKLERHDTLVSGMIRTITGESKLSVLPSDSIFGFRFWSKKDGINSETIYDGRSAFYIDHDKKTF